MKSDIRQQALTKLKNLPLELKEAKNLKLQTKILNEVKPYSTISIFESFDWEVNTNPIVESLLKQGKQVVVPKVLTKTEMVMIDIESNEVIPKEKIEVIIVPCVAFYKKHRIGYGRGYYDRYLKDYKGQTILLAFKEQKTEFTPDSFDVPVNKIIAE